MITEISTEWKVFKVQILKFTPARFGNGNVHGCNHKGLFLTRQRNEKKHIPVLILLNTFMGLNNIKMSPWLLSELYPHSLIEDPAKDQPENQNVSKKSVPIEIFQGNEGIHFIGKNQKNILIIVKNEGKLPLAENEMLFLNNMLNACKFSLDDIALIDQDPLHNYKDLIDQFRSRIILLFGTDPESIQLPMRFPHFQIQPFGGASFLFTPALRQIIQDDILKSKLWVSLRRLFAI